jgi:biopolymer transport protein ExbD
MTNPVPLIPARQARNSDDNMIPLINIVFLLLIFFMVAGQIRAMPDASLQLPKAELPKPQTQDPVRLEITNDGLLHLDGAMITLPELQVWLEQQADIQNLGIALFADQRLRAADLEPLLMLLRAHPAGSLRLYAELPANQPGQASTTTTTATATASSGEQP